MRKISPPAVGGLLLVHDLKRTLEDGEVNEDVLAEDLHQAHPLLAHVRHEHEDGRPARERVEREDGRPAREHVKREDGRPTREHVKREDGRPAQEHVEREDGRPAQERVEHEDGRPTRERVERDERAALVQCPRGACSIARLPPAWTAGA
jgi:hypothetical protein